MNLLHGIERYRKKVMQVSTLKNDIKVHYLYDTPAEKQKEAVGKSPSPFHFYLVKSMTTIVIGCSLRFDIFFKQLMQCSRSKTIENLSNVTQI